MKKLTALFLAIIMVLSLVACAGKPAEPGADTAAQTTQTESTKESEQSSQSTEGEKPAPSNLAKKMDPADLHIGVVYSQAISFFNPCDVAIKDLQAKYQDLGVKITLDIPSKGDVATQIDVIEALIAQGVDGLIICSIGDGIDSVINEATAAGIPVVMFCVDNVNSDRLCYVGTNQYDYAAKAAEYLAGLMGGKGVVVGHGGVSTASDQIDRAEGFRDYMSKNYPDITVKDIQYGDGDATKTLNNIETMYNSINPDGFYVFNSNSGATLASVIRTAGKGDCKVVADNDNPEVIQAIREGLVDASQCQTPYTMITQSFDIVYKCLTEAELPAEEYDYTDTIFITADNVDQYYDKDGKAIGVLR